MKEITPPAFRCHTDTCCPAVFETEAGSYVIIGSKLSDEEQKQLNNRIDESEYAVEIPKGMIDQLLAANAKQ